MNVVASLGQWKFVYFTAMYIFEEFSSYFSEELFHSGECIGRRLTLNAASPGGEPLFDVVVDIMYTVSGLFQA